MRPILQVKVEELHLTGLQEQYVVFVWKHALHASQPSAHSWLATNGPPSDPFRLSMEPNVMQTCLSFLAIDSRLEVNASNWLWFAFVTDLLPTN